MKATLLLVLACAACGAPALQTVRIENHTTRAIEELYVYPAGAANPGKSRGTLAPGATTQVAVKPGDIEVRARSAKIQIDQTTRDVPEASQELEIHGPAEVVLYDADSPPPGLNRPGVFGIAFVLRKPQPPPEP